MLIDALCVLVLVIFGLLGAWHGVRTEVFGLLAVVLIALVAPPAGSVLGGAVAGATWSATRVELVKLGAAGVVALALYAAVRLWAARTNRAREKRRRELGGRLTPALWSRYWGAALNVVKAAIVCWLILSFFVAFPRVTPAVKTAADRSWSAKTTNLYNPFARWIRRR